MEFHSSFYYSANPKSSPAHPSLKQPSFGPTKQNCPKSSASHHHPSFAYQLRPIILTPLQSSQADHQCALHFQIMWPHTSSTLRLTLWDTLALSHLPFSSSLSSLPTSPSHWLIYLTQIVPLIRQLPICHLLVYITTFNLKQQLRSLVVSPKPCPVSRVPHFPVLPPRAWFWRWAWVGMGCLGDLVLFPVNLPSVTTYQYFIQNIIQAHPLLTPNSNSATSSPTLWLPTLAGPEPTAHTIRSCHFPA